eukprot:12895979-Prorocentrum_lima.AAC.1
MGFEVLHNVAVEDHRACAMHACCGAEDVDGLHLVTLHQMRISVHGDAVGHGAAQATARLARHRL